MAPAELSRVSVVSCQKGTAGERLNSQPQRPRTAVGYAIRLKQSAVTDAFQKCFGKGTGAE